MIDRNKKYRLANRIPYVMLDIHEGIVFGRYVDGERWLSITHYEETGDSNQYVFINHDHKLVEITPYDGWHIDDKVWVWSDDHTRQKRHFAGISNDGKALVFKFGKSSWTAPGIPIEPLEEWDFAELDIGER